MIRTALQRWLGMETRSAPDSPLSDEAWLRAIPPAAFAAAGGVESNLPVAHACVSLQSRVLAGLPFAAYRRLPDGGRERISEGALARMLERPNAWQSRFALIESIVRALHYSGNYYAEVEYNRDGTFKSLSPLPPGSVIPETTISGAIRYKVSAFNGRPARTLVEGELLHVRGPTAAPTDLVGQSTVSSARAALGLAMSLNNAAKEVADSGLKIAGVLTHPGKLSQPARDNLRQSFEAQPNRAGGIKVLEEGSRFVPTTFSAADAELLQSRQFAAEDVARIFSTPSAMVGLQRNSSYGSAAQDTLNFATTCLGPLANRIEDEFGRCLLSEDMRAEIFFEFTLDGLLRADPNERFRQYDTGRRVGLYSPNDLRRLENMPPRTDASGDSFDPPPRTVDRTAEPPIATVRP